MKKSNNTILVTGGGSGIGFETAKLLSEAGNKVLIIGRNQAKLEKAAAQLKNVSFLALDITVADDVDQLVKKLESDFPDLNIVMNNAATAHVYDIKTAENMMELAQEEMFTNYLSVIRLNEKVLPLLKRQPEAAIINVSSIVAFVPGNLVGYSASKAALHSYTQILRMGLEETSVKVFELMPPLVNTEFSKPIGGENGISPVQVAQELIEGLESDRFEIHVGGTADFYKLYHADPAAAFDAMQGRTKPAEA